MRFIDRHVWSRATRPRASFHCMCARLVAGSLVLAVLVSSSAMALPGPQETSPEQSRPEGAAASPAPAPAGSPRLSPCPTVPAPHGRKTLKTPQASLARHSRLRNRSKTEIRSR